MEEELQSVSKESRLTANLRGRAGALQAGGSIASDGRLVLALAGVVSCATARGGGA